ncbi:unnamed protein product [Caenorhabditis bovis]|uniref:G-protein coupled receptors family 1 profile domain-containing protein n=1 Tax=Caenorhabditis bovis TaxID=2654633 RepID=A0A8S1EGY9_9PELO|nr:unnamed protein product [Caenorhabditis bovis]
MSNAKSRYAEQQAQIYHMIIHESIVMTLSILGNIFLLFVIIRGNKVAKRRISPVQLLLIHTCVADLLFATLALGTEIITLLTYPEFLGSDFVCKLMRYVQMFPMYASPFLLVAISADRYQAICRPLAHFRSSRYRRPNWLAAIAWTLALIFSVPQFFVWGKQRDGMCRTVYGSEKSVLKYVYIIGFNTFAWLLPSIFAAGFYYCVCKAVRMSSANLTVEKQRNSTVGEEVKSGTTEDYIEELHKKSTGFRRQTSEFDRKRVQTVRLTITIVACNFFLWMPFCLANIIQALWPSLLSQNQTLLTYAVILGNLNSCLNPWIYILFNRSNVVKAICGQKKQYLDTSRKVSFNRTEFSTSVNPYAVTRSARLSRLSTPNGIATLSPKSAIRRNVSFNTNLKYKPKTTQQVLLARNNSDAGIPLVVQGKSISTVLNGNGYQQSEETEFRSLN